LQFFSVQGGVANAFAWLSGAGVFHGDLVFGSQNPGDTMADKQDEGLYAYPNKDPAKSLVLRNFIIFCFIPTGLWPCRALLINPSPISTNFLYKKKAAQNITCSRLHMMPHLELFLHIPEWLFLNF
jgi:hypothetical protein